MMRTIAVLLISVLAFFFTFFFSHQAHTPTTTQVVGFDLDDTLAFTSPAFTQGFNSDHKPFSLAFWGVVNASDQGRSVPKVSVGHILAYHQALGHKVVVVTARKPVDTQPCKEWVSRTFGVPIKDIYFTGSAGKVATLSKLKVMVFYGDSDSDITDAQEAGAVGIRVQRSPKSSYTRKYNPGKFGELVLQGTTD